MFGYVSSAYIYDLGIKIGENQTIKGNQYVGGLIGRAYKSMIENCYAIGSVTGNYAVGGLVGHNYSSTIINSYTICDVNGYTNVDGFAGVNEDGDIAYCYAAGDITATGDFIGGLVGENQNGASLINCVAANNTVAGGVSNVNRVAGTNAGTLSHNYAYNGMTISSNGGNAGTSATMDTLMSFNFYNTGGNWFNNDYWSIDTNDKSLERWKICDGETLPFLQWERIACNTTDPCNKPHAGTINDPFLICTVQDLVDLANHVNSGGVTNGKYWKLMNDIDLVGIANWNPIGNAYYFFRGHFEGNGKVISNLTINRGTTSMIGLFGRIYSAEIKNLGIETCQIIGDEAVGALVGYVFGISTIENCYVTEGSISGYRIVGGLIGYAYEYSYLITIKNCYAIGNVTGTYSIVGGLVGWLRFGTISGSHAFCEVNGDNSVGGLVGTGDHYGIIDKSYAVGNVQSTSSSTGGLVGSLADDNYFNITDCYATGNITGAGISNFYIGGLVGYISLYCNIINCYSPGNITVTGTSNFHIGGLVGLNNGFITNCYATGNITGTGKRFGGLAGSNPGTLINCVAANAIVASGISDINRIAGTDYGTNLHNYAYDGMVITPNGGESGISATMGTLMSFNLYNTGSNWYSSIPWDIDIIKNPTKIWGICDNETLPFLQWQVEEIECSPADPCNEPHAGTFGDPYLICTVQDLVNFANHVNSGGATTGKYWKIMNDLNLGGINNWNPIGNSSFYFQGHFDGNGKVIANLTISRAATNYIGLFGCISNAEIKNLGIEACQITGNEYVGALVGTVSGISTIENCYVTSGNISGYKIVGGLIGEVNSNSNVTINNCYTTGSVTGTGEYVGGLVGWLFYTTSNISNCYAICEVSGFNAVGGLMGGVYNYGIIEKCYALGNIQGRAGIGGLTGPLFSGNLNDCYATGNLNSTGTPNYTFGGLVSSNYLNTYITNCYATGDITAEGSIIGGLVGNNSNGYIFNCYATGNISTTGISDSYMGGLAGVNYGTITYCYATGDVSGNGTSDSGHGGLVGYSTSISTIQNCVAANTNVVGTSFWINRVSGMFTAGSVHSNNYAYEDMLVNGVTVGGGTHNNANGEGKPMSTLKSFNFYNTGSNWYSSIPWSIAATSSSIEIWGICDGKTLPFLQWEGFNCSKKMP